MIGKNIRKMREERKLTLSGLANKVGISPGYLSDIENGNKNNPSTELLSKISEVLNVNVEDFFRAEAEVIEKVQNWSDKMSMIKDPEAKYRYASAINDFAEPEEAIQFILKQPAIMGYGGFDVKKMSNDEIVEFANELLNQLKLLGYKYKK